jgi:hypothetical protein
MLNVVVYTYGLRAYPLKKISLKEQAMSPQAKQLDEANLSKLNDLEKKLGKCVVAWDQKLDPAVISEAELKELQALEKDLNAVLVAYNC